MFYYVTDGRAWPGPGRKQDGTKSWLGLGLDLAYDSKFGHRIINTGLVNRVMCPTHYL